MPISLEEVAVRVAAALGEDNCVLVGGLAVGAWGYVRATTDVDFVVRDLSAARERLRAAGLETQRTRGEFSCLKGAIDDVGFNVLPQLVPIEWDKAKTVALGKTSRIRVVDLDGLVRLKLKAGGPQDLMDIAALVLRHPEIRERAQERALAYGIRDKLDLWLNDRRLKAQLAESAAERPPARRKPAPRRRVRANKKTTAKNSTKPKR